MLHKEIHWAALHVLRERSRRRFLFSMGAGGIAALVRFLQRVVPQATRVLAHIRTRAETIASEEFRKEALQSIDRKAYHVAGGAFAAAFLPSHAARKYVNIIAPLESLYDYLDNLCDRHPGVPASAFPALHESLSDALSAKSSVPRYFREMQSDDGGYLEYLVTQTKSAMWELPHAELMAPFFDEAAQYYAGLQSYKHAGAAVRKALLAQWYQANAPRFSDLEWWEFAAGCGSQFHVYSVVFEALRAGRSNRDAGAFQKIYDAYFPAMCALHVLLDDFIDQAEDRAHGELSFVALYGSAERLVERLSRLYSSAQAQLAQLPAADAHLSLLRVMVLFYLTHPKVYEQGLERTAARLLDAFRTRGPAPLGAGKHNGARKRQNADNLERAAGAAARN